MFWCNRIKLACWVTSPNEENYIFCEDRGGKGAGGQKTKCICGHSNLLLNGERRQGAAVFSTSPGSHCDLWSNYHTARGEGALQLDMLVSRLSARHSPGVCERASTLAVMTRNLGKYSTHYASGRATAALKEFMRVLVSNVTKWFFSLSKSALEYTIDLLPCIIS